MANVGEIKQLVFDEITGTLYNSALKDDSSEFSNFINDVDRVKYGFRWDERTETEIIKEVRKWATTQS